MTELIAIFIWLAFGIAADLLGVLMMRRVLQKKYGMTSETYWDEWKDTPWWAHAIMIIIPPSAFLVYD